MRGCKHYMGGVFGVHTWPHKTNDEYNLKYFTKKDAELPSLPVESRFKRLAICRYKHGSLEPSLLDKNCWPLCPRRCVTALVPVNCGPVMDGTGTMGVVNHMYRIAKINLFLQKFCPSNFTRYTIFTISLVPGSSLSGNKDVWSWWEDICIAVCYYDQPLLQPTTHD